MSATFDQALSAAWAAALVRCPGISVDRGPIAASLIATGVEATQLQGRGADLVLAHAAAAGDRVAISALEIEFALARDVVRRYAIDLDRTEEILQRLRIHLFVADPGATPRIARYDGHGPLVAWIRMSAARMALYALRAERNRHEVEYELADSIAALPADDPVIEQLRLRHAELVAAALRHACELLPRRLRAVVRLLFVDGASVDDIAAMYGVHRVTVWRWVQDARATLVSELRTRLSDAPIDLELGTASLIAWVQDQVNLSLDQALSPTLTDDRARPPPG
ncbi:MAG: sigma-70 family RNA polymerase sigma factor [Kofleriaceae bacterium]|nr:sigma-70 family RNA polymerase sigma factor [Kofleriaceae bacterium]